MWKSTTYSLFDYLTLIPSLSHHRYQISTLHGQILFGQFQVDLKNKQLILKVNATYHPL